MSGTAENARDKGDGDLKEMIVTLKPNANHEHVKQALADLGLWARRLDGNRSGSVFLISPGSRAVPEAALLAIEGVLDVARAPSAHPRVDAMPKSLTLGRTPLGRGHRPVVISGPCSLESAEQTDEMAATLSSMGVEILRGGAFKPRTSPYDFHGHGTTALSWMRQAADRYGMAVVTEALASEHVPAVAEVADLIQIGSRNMHNYALLRDASQAGRPILLKRGMAATLEEWLSAGEHCLVHGAPGVVFCERGVRGFDSATRNVLDLATVAILSEVHSLPVIVDPSHAAGRRDIIAPLSRAAVAVGAAGLLIECHARPGRALSDGPQALPPQELASLLDDLEIHGGPRWNAVRELPPNQREGAR